MSTSMNDVKGYVAETANVEGLSAIGPESKVEGFAIVKNTNLLDSAIAKGSSQIYGSFMYDNTQISDSAYINRSYLYNEAHIYGNARISLLIVKDICHVFGNAYLYNTISTNSFIILAGNCKFGGSANFRGLFTIEDFVNKYGKDHAKNESNSVLLTDIWDMG